MSATVSASPGWALRATTESPPARALLSGYETRRSEETVPKLVLFNASASSPTVATQTVVAPPSSPFRLASPFWASAAVIVAVCPVSATSSSLVSGSEELGLTSSPGGGGGVGIGTSFAVPSFSFLSTLRSSLDADATVTRSAPCGRDSSLCSIQLSSATHQRNSGTNKHERRSKHQRARTEAVLFSVSLRRVRTDALVGRRPETDVVQQPVGRPPVASPLHVAFEMVVSSAV